MSFPRFRLRTLMIAVAVVAFALMPIAACLSWLHRHNAFISINGFTIRF